MLVSRNPDFGEIWVLAHAFRFQNLATGVSAKSLICFELLMPYAGNLDFQISARFGFWLTPFDPGVSA